MKKKILFVMSRMSIGGSQKSLVNAVRQIDPSQYDITLYVRENKTELLKDIPDSVRVVVNTNNNKKYYYYPSVMVWELLRRIATAFKNKKLLEFAGAKGTERVVRLKIEYERKHYGVLSEQYDILISYLQGYTCKFAADVVEAKHKICFYHNSTDATPTLHKKYLPQFDDVIVVTKNCQEFLTARYPDISDRIHVIENLMDISSIQRLSKEAICESKPDKMLLCTCGRMSPEKGYELAVDAAKILKENNIPFIWWFVGDGPMRSMIEQKIFECGLADSVIVLGSKQNPYPYIGACDIYVQPSLEEAQGLVIMEAQVLMKPVISTQTLGARSLIRDGEIGLLADFSGENIAKMIIKMFSNTELRENVTENINHIDYEAYNEACRARWQKLLEGKSEELH